jgi:LysM repeat protein
MLKKIPFSLQAVLIYTLLFFTVAEAAPHRYGYDEEHTQTLREMRDTLDMLRHELDNHDSEIRMFQERVNNQEATLSSLRQQVLDANQAHKELVKGNSHSFEVKISSLEGTNKSLIADISQLKTHANESTAALAQYKQKISELEKIIASQTKSITGLQSALRSLTEAMQAGEGTVAESSAEGSKTYVIRPGDTLEKIAHAHNTTVKAIKELNQLNHDKIIVGKKIQIP